MPEFQTFLSGSTLDEFWHWVKWLLFYVAPIVMISIALTSADHVVQVLKGVFKKNDKDDDDDEYDVYRY